MKPDAPQRKDRNTGVLFKSLSEEWYTPTALFDEFNCRWGPFTLDPCATAKSAKCTRFYTREDNGLVVPWSGRVFVNPPYGHGDNGAAPWVQRAYELTARGEIELAAFLIPARTETAWWQDYVEPDRLRGLVEVRFLRSRVCFGYPAHYDNKGRFWPEALEGHPKRPATFPSAVVVFRRPDLLRGGRPWIGL